LSATLEDTDRPAHRPVLMEEAIRLLLTDPNGIYLDATLGGAGHSAALLASLGARGQVVGLDCDPAAIARAERNPPAPAPRFRALRARFSDMGEVLSGLGVMQVDGILADLGLSSDQLDDPARGLSFARPGPLDMRLDPSLPQTADEFLRAADDETLRLVFERLGELPRSRGAVRAIRAAQRAGIPLTTDALRAALEPLYRGPERPRRLSQAFQAIRIAVNRELAELDALLSFAPQVVRPGGTLCVISFHSLEDRRVKHAFRPSRPLDPRQPVPESPWVPLTRKPIRPSDEECILNPRARSARLRAARRKGNES
jgi:16S rRNA (cytosine1402-N4)-methyltransferase